MTQLSRDDVIGLARLSGLALSDEEIENFRDEIGNILEYVKQLDELDTEGVSPTYQVNSPSNAWRADEVKPSLSGNALVSLAPDSTETQIKVPKVL